jgi:ribosome-associated protein
MPTVPAALAWHAVRMGERLAITGAAAIDADELEWSTGPSGGPGGQHANRAHTRVEVRFDVAGSPSLDDHHRARLLARLGPLVRVSVDDERSQARNRALALERLLARLAAGLHVDPPRRATRPSAGARERRLRAKRRQSQRKQDRRPPPGE